MRNRTCAFLIVGCMAWASGITAAEAPPAVSEPAADGVQFTIRICEGKDKLKFWFNDEAKEHWATCSHPIPDVPVFIVSESGQRVEAKTGKDGIASVPKLSLLPHEKFRMAMACTTHNCFSLHGLFVGAPDIAPGINTMYAETVARAGSTQK